MMRKLGILLLMVFVDIQCVANKAKQSIPTGNLVVLSAAKGVETAYSYKEKGHGLFTYFLLKKLQETQGDLTLK